MPANLAIQNPADVVNVALRRIGYKLRVGNLYDGSKASNYALDIYAQTRDELLRQSDWGFAERNITLVLLKQAPQAYVPPISWDPSLYPPIPWIFSYGYPDDCLKVRAVKGVPVLVPNFDPQPNIYATPNDNSYTPARKVLCCNVPDAVLVYTGQVTDPATWESDFIEALAAALGRRLAPNLVNMDVVKLEAADEAASQRVAEMEQG